MAHCATELLPALDAKTYAIDMNDVDLPVVKTIKRNPAEKNSIDKVQILG